MTVEQTPTVDVTTLAQRLDTAALTVTATGQLTDETSLDVDEAYAVQTALIARRLDRGEHLTGLKMGLTSRAKMAQVGVDEVIWGRLTNRMDVPDGGTLDLTRHIHPRVEPEIAFLLDRLPEPGEALADFTTAVRAVAPALEVIDSRYANFRFSLPDVIADNASAAAYTIGAWTPVPDGIDNLGVLLDVNGRTTQIGSTAAILGDPRRALDEALRLTARHHLRPAPGWVFLAGAATAAVNLRPGDHVRASIEKLGTVSLRATS